MKSWKLVIDDRSTMPDAATLSIAGLGGLTLALAMRMSAINVEQMQLARAAADPKRAAARFLQGALRGATCSVSRVSLCPSVPLFLSLIARLSVCSLSVSCPLSPRLPVSHSLVLFSVSLSHLYRSVRVLYSLSVVGCFSRSLSPRTKARTTSRGAGRN